MFIFVLKIHLTLACEFNFYWHITLSNPEARWKKIKLYLIKNNIFLSDFQWNAKYLLFPVISFMRRYCSSPVNFTLSPFRVSMAQTFSPLVIPTRITIRAKQIAKNFISTEWLHCTNKTDALFVVYRLYLYNHNSSCITTSNYPI